MINFTKVIVKSKGSISEDDLSAFLASGYMKGIVVEVVGYIAKNIFNNYTNLIAETDIDFPEVTPI